MLNWRLWLRWSWRDLRARWIQVAAIALIIALGTGMYAGLGSNKHWRKLSYDASYAALNMYDLRLKLTEGSYVSAERLIEAVRTIPHADQITAVEPRLRLSTLVEVQADGEAILVPGEIIGVPLAEGGPVLNGFAIEAGRALAADDAGRMRVLLEYNFAHYHDLPPEGTLYLSGGTEAAYVGQAITPEYFMVMPNELAFFGEASFAGVFTSLETAQQLSDRDGMANDLLLALDPAASVPQIRNEITAALSESLPNTGYSILTPEDDLVRTTLYGDLESDDQMMKIIAYLFLAGATFGAFNLSTRIVEAQRREIGVGMSLGMPRYLLALRPMLVGLQIAILGVIFGLAVGMILNEAFRSLLRTMLLMPVWRMPFAFDVFVWAALLGVVMPVLATLYPVWRAVRVTPIEAIKTGHLVAKSGGLASRLAHVPLPGKSMTQMPLRNLLRSPRRTVVTLLGVTMAIATLITIVGMLDSFLATIDAAQAEISGQAPDRIAVTLDTFYSQDAAPVQAVTGSDRVETAVPALLLGGKLIGEQQTIDISIELLDMDNPLWTPTLIDGAYRNERAGILLAEKAADDLGVSVGDRVLVLHPQRRGVFDFRMVETALEVTGIHASPLRFQAYMDSSQADMMGLQGMTNELHVTPAPGVSLTELKRSLFEQPGVASVVPFDEWIRQLEEEMGLFISIMSVVVIAVLLLAFLIAFNSTSINVDERSREIATMFAFGLPIRTVTRMAMLENLIIGVLGTLLGVGLGYALTVWTLNARIEVMLPDIGLIITLSAMSFGLAILVGVIVVMLTPLLSIRKMTRMDLPSTLRVME